MLNPFKKWLESSKNRSPITVGTIEPDNVPAHVAIIMDGNGRWAKQRGLPRVACIILG